LLQALLYNLLLSKVQGYLPPTFIMVDRHLGEAGFEYGVYVSELKQALQEMEDVRAGKVRPEPVYDTCGDAYWKKYCDAQAEAARDISLVPYLKDERIRTQMIAANIRTVDDLARLSPSEISRFKWVGSRSELIFQQTQCLLRGKEAVLSRVVFPPAKGAEVYLDLEDTGNVHPTIPHFVFLIGVTVRKPGLSHESYSFVIHSETAVLQKTNEFLALLDGLGDYQVYSWSKKEIVEFAKIFDAHGLSNPSVQRFQSRCLDLKDVFEDKVYFPVHGYSVKEIAQFLGYKWREAGVDAMEGMALTYEYLEAGNKEALKKVQTYNEDDCLAMMTIKDWLIKNAT
jgi:predicted RecB family nuclease